MKISSIKTYMVGNQPPYIGGGPNWVFLKLLTDEGIEGVGEAKVPFEPYIVVQMIEDMGEEFVLGSDPFNIEKLWQLLYNGRNSEHPDLTRLSIISAFDMACWDIVGKALNQPIYNLLGGKFHEKLRAYSYLYPSPEQNMTNRELWVNPEQTAIRAVEYVEQGFTALKIDPISSFLGLAPLGPKELSLEALRSAEAVIKSMRNAIGDKCDILIGTHGQMTTHSAISLAKRLEEYHPLWYEEPIHPENRDELARVARATSIPIATGERLSTKYEFAELLEKQAASILQICVGRVGGITEAKKIAGMAEVHYAQIAPFGAVGPISAAASVQVDVCIPNFLMQEGPGTWSGFRDQILREPIKWENGYLIPPTKPGLGVELDEEKLAKYPPNSRKVVKAHWDRLNYPGG
jgi:2-dehydro-3-deoxyphosphogalactonate aldolase